MRYRGDKMIEHFDMIYSKNKGATNDDFKNLYKWLRAKTSLHKGFLKIIKY